MDPSYRAAVGPQRLGSDIAPGRLDVIVAAAGIASGLTAAWLLLVVATALPSRDPNGRLGWTLFALALIGFVALTATYLARRPQARWLRLAVTSVAVIAIIVGVYILFVALTTVGHFEGYLVVIGAVVLVHGAAVVWHASLGRLHREIARAP
jgi:hypothetical protein